MVEKVLMDMDGEIRCHLANSYEEAQKLMRDRDMDIAFLDIEISKEKDGKTGLDFAKDLYARSPQTKIIFVTSYPIYALNAYEVQAFDFVVKPIDIERLKSSAKRALDEVNRIKRLDDGDFGKVKGDRLFIRTNKEMVFMPYSEIVFIEKISKEVVIHTEKTQVGVRWTLAELEEMLPSQFVRVHKSFLVNAGKITRIVEFGDRTYEIFFGNLNKTAILSRYKVNDLFEVMNVPTKE